MTAVAAALAEAEAEAEVLAWLMTSAGRQAGLGKEMSADAACSKDHLRKA